MCASAELSSSATAFSAAALAFGFAADAVMNPSLYPAHRYASDRPEYAGAKVESSSTACSNCSMAFCRFSSLGRLKKYRPRRYASCAAGSTLGAVARRDCSPSVRRTLIARAMAEARSACSASTSSELRSKLCAHRCRSARASMSCAVIRTRSPERTTEPSTTASTSSAFAISGVAGRFLPWNCMADPREMTRSWLMVARAAVSSSVIPSAK